MKKAVFLDFYGTIVYENGPIAMEVTQKVCSTGIEKDPITVYRYWWKSFSAYLKESNAGVFYNQYTLARRAFCDTVTQFKSSEDPDLLCSKMIEHWSNPTPYPEYQEFLDQLPYPYYIVTNADAAFLDIAVQKLGLNPAGVITSEKACAYKPDKRIFEFALRQAQLKAEDVVQIGDSMENDIIAANTIGIDGIWLNREQKENGAGVKSLIQALGKI